MVAIILYLYSLLTSDVWSSMWMNMWSCLRKLDRVSVTIGQSRPICAIQFYIVQWFLLHLSAPLHRLKRMEEANRKGSAVWRLFRPPTLFLCFLSLSFHVTFNTWMDGCCDSSEANTLWIWLWLAKTLWFDLKKNLHVKHLSNFSHKVVVGMVVFF